MEADVGIAVWFCLVAVYQTASYLQAKGPQQQVTTMHILQPLLLLLLMARMSVLTKQLTNPLQCQQMQMRPPHLQLELLQLLPQQLDVEYKPVLWGFGPAGLVVVCPTRYTW